MAFQFGLDLGFVAVAVVVGIIAAAIAGKVVRTVSSISEDSELPSHLRALQAPLRLLFPILFLFPIVGRLGWPAQTTAILVDILQILFIASAAWLGLRAVAVGEKMALVRFRVDVADNLKARQVHTQVKLIRRIISALVLVLAAGVIMLTLEPVRRIGTTLLASAGVLGIIIGFAAQRSIGMVLAGLQVAIAQPIRLDDVVIVEGEWGRIEEITLTYVVVRVWDLRRLVLPVSYFIEQPFQNWTRVSAELLGTVFLYTDYTVRVDDLRRQLQVILGQCPNWDGKVAGIQVTNADDHTVELRALMSAADAPRLWDLRCEVREHLIAYLQANYPEALPRTRAELREQEPSRDRQDGQEVPPSGSR